MPVEVTMPRLSDTMEQGTIVAWSVKEGDEVSAGDTLGDIETDKATMELQTFDDGTVAAIMLDAGETVDVGSLILVIAEEGEDPSEVKAQYADGGAGAGAGGASASASTSERAASANGESGGSGEGSVAVGSHAGPETGAGAVAAGSGDSGGSGDGGSAESDERGAASSSARNGRAGGEGSSRIFASPLARKIAAEKGVDLASVEGSGPSGRIVSRDLESLASKSPASASLTSVASISVPSSGDTLESKTIPLSNMRATIARRLVEAKQTVPHYQVTVAVDMDPLISLRGQLNEQLSTQGVKLSVNDFLVRACALAMHQHPHVNCSWGADGRTLVQHPAVNVGVAVALPIEEDGTGGGLVVATLRNADTLGLRKISADTKALANKARERGLSIEEMSDATFTISNLGMFGVEHFTAIINPPNAAILAVGAAVEKPVVRDGEIVVGHEMQMTMSSDHRIIDGAMAAQYLQTVKGYLESPATLLI